MSDRYTKAKNGFFDDVSSENNDATAIDTDTESMSTKTAADSTSTDSKPTPIANETSCYYIGLGHTKAVASAFAKAHPKMSLNWSGKSDDELHPHIRYVKALHEVKSRLGERQREHNECAIGFGQEGYYADAFGDILPSIKTVELHDGVLDALRDQEGRTDEWEEGDTDELGRGLPLLFPVIDGVELPPYVTGEAGLNEALAALSKIPDEPAVAEPEPEPEASATASSHPFFASDDGDGDGDDLPEGLPNPRDLTVDELKAGLDELTTEAEVEAMLAAERQGKARKTAIKALERRLNALEDEHEATPTTAPSSSGDGDGNTSIEEKVEILTALLDKGVSAAEAKEIVGL